MTTMTVEKEQHQVMPERKVEVMAVRKLGIHL